MMSNNGANLVTGYVPLRITYLEDKLSSPHPAALLDFIEVSEKSG
jgi:hypothetical protein